jgi:predicted dehydrogenase
VKSQYNIGIIGYGGFGRFLHYHWNALDHIRVAAVADQRPMDPGTGIRIYADWNEMLQDPDLDIIAVATPPCFHADMACAAMEAGKHVLIEKPLAVTLKDARRIIQARDHNNRIACLDYMFRFNPIVLALRHINASSELGQLRHVAVENLAQDSGLPYDHWFWDKSVSGGIFIEHGVHFFDLVRYVSGQSHIGVTAFSNWRNKHQEDQVYALVKHSGGLLAAHYHAFSRPGFFETTSIKLVFDLAQIEVRGWIPLTGTITALINAESKQVLDVLPGFQIDRSAPIDLLKDDSRPEGWGDASGENHFVTSGGTAYGVDTMIEGRFSTGRMKGEVYGSCVQAVLLDMIKAIEDTSHQLAVPLEEAFESLAIAIEADQSANA